MTKRCICGKSRRFPVCDGTHKTLDWVCGENVAARVDYAFVAAPHNENLAERLASELKGVAVHTVHEAIRAARLVLIVDAASIAEVRELSARVEAAHRRVVAIDLDAGLVASLFPESEVVAILDAPPLAVWRAVRDAVTRDADAPRASRKLAPAFVSHAVADEPLILPALGYLREHLRADLFVCADSIEIGSSWFDTIVGELRRRPTLVWILSKRSALSTFCAFEIGYAMASASRVVVVSIDGERPPSFAQHLHAIDVERRRTVRPWLDAHELLAEAVIEALAIDAPRVDERAP